MPEEKLRQILSEVSSKITPSTEEAANTQKQAETIINKLNKTLKSVGAKATIQGSFKKNTQLRHTFDIDVFVGFNFIKYAKKDSLISDILCKKLSKIFKKIERMHGSRDYFQIHQHPYVFEIIPILNITSSKHAKNITDVSPLHAKWVAKKSKGKEGEIRLTKAFFKAQGIYGAESYVRGFSGYAAEILTLYYGSFIKLLKAAIKWEDKVVIDPEKAYKYDNPLLKLNQSKVVSPLVVVDPVQPERNVTAALSKDAFKKLKGAASQFTKKPSKDFFTKKINSKEDLLRKKPKNCMLLIVEIEPQRGKHDVVGAAILGKYEILKRAISENNFCSKENSWFWEKGEKGVLWFFISRELPEKMEIRRGPSIKDAIHPERFRKKHKSTFVKNGRLYAKVRRKFLTPKELIDFTVQQPNFREKIKSERIEWH
jgi:tRNA nucleotidyltransferase (CCA-adding enzyme)